MKCCKIVYLCTSCKHHFFCFLDLANIDGSSSLRDLPLVANSLSPLWAGVPPHFKPNCCRVNFKCSGVTADINSSAVVYFSRSIGYCDTIEHTHTGTDNLPQMSLPQYFLIFLLFLFLHYCHFLWDWYHFVMMEGV